MLKKCSDMPDNIEKLATQIVDCAFQVHTELGPGLNEKIYEDAFSYELETRHIPFERQKRVKVQYKNIVLSSDYKIDLLIDGKIVLELKTVEKLAPVHEAQIISYMRLVHAPLGFLINFNETLVKDGIRRILLPRRLHSFTSSL